MQQGSGTQELQNHEVETMRYAYPVVLERDEDGRYVALAPDVPEAVTEGVTKTEALMEMSTALAAALAGYVKAGNELPQPSAASREQYVVPVAALVAAKLALRSAMQAQGITNVELARRLGVTETVVRRLVDPDHASKLERVVAALHALGRGLIVEDQPDSAAA